MHVKQQTTLRQEDYYLVLHALLDQDSEIRMTARMASSPYAKEPYFVDPKGLSLDELTKKVEERFPGFTTDRPQMVEYKSETGYPQMSKELSNRQGRAERDGEWDGPFPKAIGLLNALREDTQGMILNSLTQNETVDRAYIGFYIDAFKPFRDGKRSLDSHTTVAIVNLNHATPVLEQYGEIETMIKQLERPVYLLVVLTNRRLILFLRDHVQSSRAVIRPVSFGQMSRITSIQAQQTMALDIETHHDQVKIPPLLLADGLELDKLLKERSINAIQADESFIDRDFDKEISRLDLLYKARTIPSSEYMFRKMRLQKMELEKFSDKNIELLLAKRFSDGTAGKKLDEQLLKKFTFEKTIMFTDIVGYSAKAAEKELLDTMTMLAVHDRTLMPIIAKHQGQLIKKIGDALMVKYDDPLEACYAAQEMQQALIEFNRSSDEKILIRIGINTGTVFMKNNDVFGDAVNVAARMESMAQPGRIFITQGTEQKVREKISVQDCGSRRVKGQKHPLRVFAIIDVTNADQEMLASAEAMKASLGLPSETESAVEESVDHVVSSSEAASTTSEPVRSEPQTPEEAIEAMKSSIADAVQLYKKAVHLGY
ncbi:MAG TPA: adenylate/guanylate cyclase domain-containing protein, partial [Candidatus Ozemobacteraceae bacterium]|nr:adenylate/guanylate cyclase domain-containing protein [Candidatus Ozemobacteraceae bacterium]